MMQLQLNNGQTIDENRINDIPFSIFNHQSETVIGWWKNLKIKIIRKTFKLNFAWRVEEIM